MYRMHRPDSEALCRQPKGPEVGRNFVYVLSVVERQRALGVSLGAVWGAPRTTPHEVNPGPVPPAVPSLMRCHQSL